MTCTVLDCSRDVLAKSLCSLHYGRQRRLGTTDLKRWPPTCTVDGCTGKHRSHGYCQRHYMRWWKHGDPGPVESTRRIAPERAIVGDGYAVIRRPEHPRADKAGMVLEHIVVMETELGRPLLPGENVHHRNGVRDDNRPDNLELWVIMQPRGQRPADLVEWAHEVLRRYGEVTA